jgi:arylsulfatase
MDVLPTIAAFTGASLPLNPSDGVDISPLLRGWQTTIPRPALMYFNDVELQAARLGDWKLHVTRFNSWAFSPFPADGRINLPLPHSELYNLAIDKDESHDRSAANQDMVKNIRAMMDAQILTFPSGIVDAWTGTHRCNVQNTPAGALPALITS